MQNFYDSQEFVDQLRSHNSKSFELLFDTFGQKVFNMAYRATGNEEDASDITQETFYQVYCKIDEFRGESQLSTWIYTIAKNKCFYVLNQRKHSTFFSFEQMINEYADPNLPEDINKFTLQDLSSQVKEGCFLGLVRCLPLNQRLAFIAHVLLHFPIRDVASILEKSEGSTKVLIHRARKNLKQFICKNCSLFDPENFCQCKNMINFSLKQGWISYHDQEIDATRIETEVGDLKKILKFYSNINPVTVPESLQASFYSALQSRDWMIFRK